jgi:hypothetical protein
MSKNIPVASRLAEVSCLLPAITIKYETTSVRLRVTTRFWPRTRRVGA